MRAGSQKSLPSSLRRSPPHIFARRQCLQWVRPMAVTEVRDAARAKLSLDARALPGRKSARAVPVHLRRAVHARQPSAQPADKVDIQCAGLGAPVSADGRPGTKRSSRPTSRFVAGGALRQNGRRRRSVNLSASLCAAGPTITRRPEREHQGNPAPCVLPSGARSSVNHG